MLKNLFRYLSVAGLFIGLAGCDDLGVGEGAVVIALQANHILIVNNSSQALYYAVFERNELAYTDWLAICRPDNELPSGKTLILPVSSGDYLPSNVAVVYWWYRGKAYAGGNLVGADSLRVVELNVR
jgi:hypothetical protein